MLLWIFVFIFYGKGKCNHGDKQALTGSSVCLLFKRLWDYFSNYKL